MLIVLVGACGVTFLINGISLCRSSSVCVLSDWIKWVFITNVKGTFLGMSESEEAQRGAETATGVPYDSGEKT